MASRVLSRSASSLALAQPARSLATASFPSYVLSTPAYETSKLSNGVKVATEVGAGDVASVGVYIDAGSRFDGANKSGTAHFLEHLVFKGTTSKAAAALSAEIAALGGQFSGTTSREVMSFQANVFKADVPKAVALLGDILQNSVFDEAAVNAEKDIILGEIAAQSADAKEVVFNNLIDTAFQGSGLANTVYGPASSVAAITKDDLVAFAKTYITGPKVVVAGAGAVNQAQLVELAGKYFGGLASAPPAGFAPKVDAVSFIGSEVRVREDTIPLAYMAVAFETGGWTDINFFPLQVAQTLLGDWTAASSVGSDVYSSLARKLAEDNSAISVKAFTQTFKDTGLFGVYAVSEPVKARATMYTVMYELARLTNKVSDDEVERAKAQLKTAYLSYLSGPAAVCDNVGKQNLSFGRRMSPLEVFARIDAVDAAAVRNSARVVIDDKDVAVSAIGNIHEMPDYSWLRRRTYWLRG